MANKRPPTAATGAPAAAPLTVLRPINRDAAGQPLGFNFTKADPKETVAWLPAGSTALTLERPPEAGGGAGSPLILNMSPLWPLHSLFTPEQAALHPQVATPALFQDVLRLVVALEALRPGAFAGFNSLQAHASVNHFHAHTGWAEEVHKSWLRGSASASSGLVPCLGYPATPLAPQPPHLAACGLSLSLVHWALPGLQLTTTSTSTSSSDSTPATSPAHLARLATAAGELCAALAAANTAHNVLFTALPTPSITIFPRRHQADSLRGAMGVAFAECIGLAVINSQQEYEALSGEGFLSELRACALPQEQLLGILTTHCHCESQAALAALAAPPATASSSSSSACASGEPLPPPTAPPQPPHAQPFLATATPADIAARQAVFDKLVWALPFTVGKNVSNAARESASQAGLQEAGSAAASSASASASSASAASSGADSGLPPDTDLTYGETPFPVIAWALAACHSLPSGLPPPGTGLFIDLGCGVGKPLYAAALLHQWGVCRGIEMVEALLDEADLLLEDWRGGLPVLAPGSSCATNSVPPAAAAVEIELYAGDAVGVKGGSSSSSSSSGWQAPRGPGLCSDPAAHLWTPADFVYACSTCFSEGLLGALLAASLRMRPGAYFLLSSTHFEHPAWEVVAEMSSAMSWGVATCYLQRRTAWVGEA